MPVRIRPAQQADLPELIALYGHLTAENVALDARAAREILKAFKRYDGSEVFVGRVGGVMVTSCALVVIPNLTRLGKPYGLIENVVTHPAHRQRGYGRAILQAAVAAAWAAGCYKVMLLAGSRSPAILRFYESAGFSQSKTGFQIRQIALRPEQAD
jgi:GNAT superfamily N-acetyltransferase